MIVYLTIINTIVSVFFCVNTGIILFNTSVLVRASRILSVTFLLCTGGLVITTNMAGSMKQNNSDEVLLNLSPKSVTPNETPKSNKRPLPDSPNDLPAS
jgi:hypothetical protein